MLIVNCRDLRSFVRFCLVCCFISSHPFFIFVFYWVKPNFPKPKAQFPMPHLTTQRQPTFPTCSNYSSCISHAQIHHKSPHLLGRTDSPCLLTILLTSPHLVTTAQTSHCHGHPTATYKPPISI